MKTILSVVLVLLSIIALADNNKNLENSKNEKNLSISGKIIDSVSKEALAGVKISIEGINKTVYTDFEGNFNIEIPSNLNLSQLKISYISYEEKSVSISKNQNSSIIELNKVL